MEVDGSGWKWVKMDERGLMWLKIFAVLHASLMPSIAIYACNACMLYILHEYPILLESLYFPNKKYIHVTPSTKLMNEEIITQYCVLC